MARLSGSNLSSNSEEPLQFRSRERNLSTLALSPPSDFEDERETFKKCLFDFELGEAGPSSKRSAQLMEQTRNRKEFGQDEYMKMKRYNS